MVIGLLWIIGIYGFCTLLIHVLHGLDRTVNGRRRKLQIVLITLNNQLQIEWYLRSFLFVCWLRGLYIQITVFDAGSSDETIAIVHKLAKTRDHIQFELSLDRMASFMEEHAMEEIVVLQLLDKSPQDRWLIPHL
jgi:hypothetical protein